MALIRGNYTDASLTNCSFGFHAALERLIVPCSNRQIKQHKNGELTNDQSSQPKSNILMSDIEHPISRGSMSGSSQCQKESLTLLLVRE